MFQNLLGHTCKSLQVRLHVPRCLEVRTSKCSLVFGRYTRVFAWVKRYASKFKGLLRYACVFVCLGVCASVFKSFGIWMLVPIMSEDHNLQVDSN